MIGKKFTSLLDGKLVEVKDIFEDIVILNDNSKIKSSRLLDKSYYDEYIDPKSFFQNQSLLNSFAQKIKQIPDEVLNKMTETGDYPSTLNTGADSLNESFKDNSFRPTFNESAVLPADPEFEKEELMRKYGIQNPTINQSPMLEAQRQLEQFKSLLEEPQVEEVQRIEINREESPIQEVVESNLTQLVSEPATPSVNVEDPIITMFKNVKRNKDFKISIEIENRIPRPDFIEMMEDSYTTSIIQFLADEFTNEILKNPDLIRDKIIKEINQIVYGEENKETEINHTETEKKPVTKRTTKTKKSEIIND